jgi:hypothetical protein
LQCRLERAKRARDFRAVTKDRRHPEIDPVALIHPEETRDALLSALQRGIFSRQAAAEPVSRTVITP